MTRAVVGWLFVSGRALASRVQADQNRKGPSGVVVGSLTIKTRRVDTLGYALQASLDGRSGVVIPAMLSLDDLDRISQFPTPEVALSLAREPRLGVHVMPSTLVRLITLYFILYCPH